MNNRGRFDSNIQAICIDNCCSKSLKDDSQDFLPDLIQHVQQPTVMQGFSISETPIMHICMIKWDIVNDNRVTWSIVIPNSYYIKSSGNKLLSQQHWAQENNEVHNEGSIYTTYGCKICLSWNHQQHHKTVPTHPNACNTGILSIKPRYHNYQVFATLF
jgi:hypothetical protein